MEGRGCIRLLLVLWLLVWHGGCVMAILDPVDFLALQALPKSLEDMPGSAFFDGWDFTADPCGFPGVFCAGDRVVGLALGDPRAGSPGLSGYLDPDALGQLTALSELSLVPGRVAGPIPASLGRCTDLRFLALSRNLLSGPIPPSLAGLTGLRTLDLSYNQLTGEIPAGLPFIPALANLILCHNQLTGAIPLFPDNAASSSELLRLDLKHNQLSGAIPQLPTSLEYLALGSNALTSEVAGVLPRLTRLNFLDLSANKLEGPIPACVFMLPLAALQLQRNLFTGPVVPAGAEVSIPVVDLSYNRLWGTLPPQLAAVGRLYLNNNHFTGEVPGRLVQGLGSGMQLLYLQHNFLTGVEIGPAAAASIPAGASLCLQYNCMVPPVDTPCPLKAGWQKTRPTDQCPEWRP